MWFIGAPSTARDAGCASSGSPRFQRDCWPLCRARRHSSQQSVASVQLFELLDDAIGLPLAVKLQVPLGFAIFTNLFGDSDDDADPNNVHNPFHHTTSPFCAAQRLTA
jgi:hypothetical protein